MNIVMVSNAYRPHAAGIGRSVARLVDGLRALGHRVLLVAPREADQPAEQPDTVLLPAAQSFTGGDFAHSVPLLPAALSEIEAFAPDVVHSHYSFLLGTSAVRIASKLNVPLVYSHHPVSAYYPERDTLAGPYWHAVRALAEGYGALADLVIVSNRADAWDLQQRGVDTPIEILPPGVAFPAGERRQELRQALSIEPRALLIGYHPAHDRLLEQSLVAFLKRNVQAHLLLLGDPKLTARFASEGPWRGELRGRVHTTARCKAFSADEIPTALDAYVCLSRVDCEAGRLAEMLAAGVPIVSHAEANVADLLRDGENAFFVHRLTQRSILEALAAVSAQNEQQRETMRQAARQSVAHLTIPAWAERTINCYQNLLAATPRSKTLEESGWDKARRRIAAEWSLLENRARSAQAALTDGRHPSRVPVLRHLVAWWRKLRLWISRREWSVVLSNLPVFRGAADEPGLVLLQIDGLSRQELERALDAGRMPFLKSLIDKEHYALQTMYSGLPATTPAVLGELFFGVRQAVPAFGFRDHRSGDVVQMFQPGIASTVQEELSQRGAGLLAGGSAYCDIYSGGATNASFCPATTGWHNLEDMTTWRRLLIFLLNLMSMARMFMMGLLELIVALRDGFRGIYRGQRLFQELIYIPRRVIVNIALREFLAVGVEIDVTRGVPIVHANLLGYDENSHRRGPDARFAHYALRGIDRVLRRIWDAAHASHRRDYRIWIMADHGQQRTMPYYNLAGEMVGEAVERLYRPSPQQRAKTSARLRRQDAGIERLRSSWLLRHKPVQPLMKTSEKLAQREADSPEPKPLTVAIGPLGYVYWPEPLTSESLDVLAMRLVREAQIPLVVAADGSETFGWTKDGKHRFPEEAPRFLSPNHPHLTEVIEDLTTLCRHPDAGDLMILGWRNDGLPLSFVEENGGHAGPGPLETSGFALLPPDAPLPEAGVTFRPLQLRQMAQAVMGRRPVTRLRQTAADRRRLRLVSYNVHSCIGLDGRLSPSRIARVLAAIDPDVIALQELDMHHTRSGFVDQAAQIAEALRMEFHFHPSFGTQEQFGSAILSRFPLRVVRSAALPTPAGREPRGALWAEIDLGDEALQLITTHLGLSPGERMKQIEELLGPNWLGHPDCREPAVLCGDFNFLPRSQPYRLVASRFIDVQLALEKHMPRRTWFGPLPLTRIDHVFASRRLRPKRIDVPRTRLSRLASDHLPLVVDLEILHEQGSPAELLETVQRE